MLTYAISFDANRPTLKIYHNGILLDEITIPDIGNFTPSDNPARRALWLSWAKSISQKEE
jgi:hypothetical protein